MKKKLDTDAMVNELRGASLFFPTSTPTAEPVPADTFTAPASSPPAGERVPPPVPGAAPTPAPTVPAEPTPSLPAAGEDVLDLADFPTRKATFPITEAEFRAFNDLKTTLERQYDHARVREEDIFRCLIHEAVKDFKQHGEASIVVRRVIKRK